VSFHGINTSRQKAKSVTHVSGTKRHLSLGSGTIVQPIRETRSKLRIASLFISADRAGRAGRRRKCEAEHADHDREPREERHVDSEAEIIAAIAPHCAPLSETHNMTVSEEARPKTAETAFRRPILEVGLRSALINFSIYFS
ncbi:hypothetical protein FHT78_005794, partial [Rhizobium sp. BK196]|uniref:hypothetical protein n=1 Tax=Rhizobium sp. BK196 TaxID=2587073 RepID=UPI0016202853